MTLFVDASAFIAIIAGEPDAGPLSDLIEADADCLCSAVSIWETVAGLVHSYAFTVEAARERVRLYREALRLRLVAIGEIEADLATDAYARFGKGRHPAALNMGDCHAYAYAYAYAYARAHGAALLFKGNDFSKTGIPQASAHDPPPRASRPCRRPPQA